VVLAFAASSWVLAGWAGGRGIPHNDDWSLIRIAQHLAGTGEFRLLGWNRAALAGQSWPAAALLRLTGGGVATLQAFHLAAAALALAAAYLLLRRSLGPGRAALGAFTLLGTPELWLLSTSVMTDALAAALVLGSLLLGVVAVQAPHRRAATAPLLGSLLLGLWAFTVREAALAAPVAVLLAAALPRRSASASLRVLALPAGAVVAVAVLAFELWRRALAAGDPPRLGLDPAATVGHALEALFWIALVLSPVTLCWAARWRSPRTWWAVAAAGGLAAVLRLGLDRPLFPANYLSQRGAYVSAGLGTRAALLPDWLWLVVCGVAVVSAGVLLGRLADQVRGEKRAVRDAAAALPVHSAFLALTLGGLLVEDVLGQTTYSRYLLVLPPVLAAFLLREPRPARSGVRPGAASAGLLCVLCALAAVLTAGTLRSDAARWQAAASLVAQGVDPMQIAAGQEWSGWHTSGVAEHDQRDAPGDVAWWTGMFGDASECWLVAMDGRPRAGYRLERAGSGVWVFRAEGGC